VAVAAVVALEHPLPARFASELDLGRTLAGLAVEAAPALLVGLAAHVVAARGPARLRALVARGAPGIVPLAVAAPWLGIEWAAAWAVLAVGLAAAAPQAPAGAPLGVAGPLAPLLLGWLLAGLAEPLVEPGLLAGTPPGIAVLAATIVGGVSAPLLPALVPIAAILAHKGLAPAAVGVLLAVPTLRRSGLGPRTRALGTVAVTAVAVAASGAGTVTPLHELARHAHGPGERLALAAAVAVIAGTLVLRGLDAFTDALRGGSTDTDPPARRPLEAP
jgi:hypothetical protein